MTTVVDLVGRGFFPKEVPPVFSTGLLAGAIAGQAVTLPANHSTSVLVRHSLARAGGLRRPLSTPHPFHFMRLATAIEGGWQAVILPHLAKNTFGVSWPKPSTGPRAFEEGGPADTDSLRASLRVGKRYLVRSDVQNFYPSLYTHSIPWALHTKPVAKQNHGHRLLGNRLDRDVREAQDKQTMGIPIGPDTSWLLGEILMIAVEDLMRAKNPSLKAYRYLDDFEVVCRGAAEAESVLGLIEECLAEFELSLNPRKTRVEQLPARIESPGIADLRRWVFGPGPRRQTRDLVSYFDRVVALRTSDPETSASSYGLARLQGEMWHQPVWEVLQSRLASFVLNEPSVLRSAARLLAAGRARGLQLNIGTMQPALEGVIEKAAPLGHGFEVAWALWIAVEHQIPLGQQATGLLGSVEDSFVGLLAMLAQAKGLLAAPLNQAMWAGWMSPSDLDGPHWLLSYEARQQGWLPSLGMADHRLSDPLFAAMAQAGVSFLDLGAATQPTFPIVIGSGPAGGGGGGGYLVDAS